MKRLPGDPNKPDLIKEIVRVDHAGEYGAKQIYKGQMSILKNPEDQKILKHMLDQELTHFDYFSRILVQKRIRPSLLMPIWNILGYAIGATTAALGRNSAHVCTEAVEEVISKHYKDQLYKLDKNEDKDLRENIKKFREEEIQHQQIAQDSMKNLHFGHKILYNLIKIGCKISIKLAKF